MSHQPHTGNRNNSLSCLIDSLEPRRLLAAAPTLDDGLLTVFGSGGSDHLSISRNANDTSELTVILNDQTNGTFDTGDVERIQVNLGKGNDHCIIDERNGLIIIPTTIMGGIGEDTLRGGTGRDLLVGGDEGDVLSGGWRCDTLDGGNGDDNLFGGPRRDLMIGGAGDDYFYGGSGGDTMRGGLGQDLMIGGVGNDVIDGEDGDDQLRGQDGNDTMNGGPGQDDLYGALGIDRMTGGTENDDFFGTAAEILDAGGDSGANETDPEDFRDISAPE